MNLFTVRTWDELKTLLDCSYSGGVTEEMLIRFRSQRAESAKRFPVLQISEPQLAQGDSVSWAEMLFRTVPEMETPPHENDNQLETIRFLAKLLKVRANGLSPDSRQQELLLTLQKRFEVNRRLFSRYDKEMRRVGNDFSDLDPYALLALTLQIMYLDCRCFSFLNTSIKLLDLITLSGWRAMHPALVSLALAMEKAILDELDAT